MIEFFNPDGVAPPQANYVHGVFVPAGADLLFIAGQVGTRPDGKVGATFAEQAECAFRNVATVLKSRGMAPADLVKVQLFLTDVANRGPLLAAMEAAFGKVKPASTLLVVKSLARPEYQIEVEAVAARAR
jgi:enamine deaminase RidA (YjgF/YER057c/UK114 family)